MDQMLERPAALDVHKERVTACVRTPGEGGHGAICLAALGGLAHPGREKKRRALLAARLLLEERPAVVAPGIALALTITSDPATLTWLLGLLGSLDGTDNPVLQTSQDALRQLATRDLLTVRAAARRMITGTPPALASSTLQETARTSDELWTPDDEDDDHKTDPPGLDVLLDAAAGQRIRLGERILPGLRPAVRSRAASVLSSDALKEATRPATERVRRPRQASLARCLSRAFKRQRHVRIVDDYGSERVNPSDRVRDGFA